MLLLMLVEVVMAGRAGMRSEIKRRINALIHDSASTSSDSTSSEPAVYRSIFPPGRPPPTDILIIFIHHAMVEKNRINRKT